MPPLYHSLHMADPTADPASAPASMLQLAMPDTSPADVKSVNKTASNAPSAASLSRRKQSKSRNGCSTCKAKRLKCDEKKPTCDQCARRAVPCGGYKKEFKWKLFEEPTGKARPTARSQKSRLPAQPSPASIHSAAQYHHDASSSYPAYYAPPQPSAPLMHNPPICTSFSQPSFTPREDPVTAPAPSAFLTTPQLISPVDSHAPVSLASCSMFGSESTGNTKTTAGSSVSSGQSPRLVDLLMPGTDLSVPPEEYSSFLTQHEAFYQPTGLTPPPPMGDDHGIEELVREAHQAPATWVVRLSSPASSSSNGSSPDSPEFRIPAHIPLPPWSPDSLSRRYHRDTCGVLSLKDGPTENPWRTLIWPLTQECPALYHAIISMTSFHQSKDTPTLRIQGIDHMRSAVHALAAGLQDMRVDAAISTTLVLAFAESWDQHISTGINHIKGAKVLINQALIQHRQMPLQGEEWARLKFLCNTWIYMDVLARLTSTDEDETYDVDMVQESIYATGDTDSTLDPLMGCAHTLFPIVGRVANLVRRVRKSDSNGPEIISQAAQLKAQLRDWTPPSFIQDPEDETTSPHDAIKTAVAYQYATLLYLHQAVPEIPSQSPSTLARKVLSKLATVDPRSRSIIVQIYPLMAAGCEVVNPDEREWVKARWQLMSKRMKLGIIERCLEVTKEVWSRRDAHAAERMAMVEDACAESYLDMPPSGEFGAYPDTDMTVNSDWRQTPASDMHLIDPEITVKGRLHWLGVMKDWSWEILLG